MTSLWRDDSFAQRLQRRAALFASPEWRDLMACVQPLVTAIESRLGTSRAILAWTRPEARRPDAGRCHSPGPLERGGDRYRQLPPDAPFIEHRIYTLKPGTTRQYLENRRFRRFCDS